MFETLQVLKNHKIQIKFFLFKQIFTALFKVDFHLFKLKIVLIWNPQKLSYFWKLRLPAKLYLTFCSEIISNFR